MSTKDPHIDQNRDEESLRGAIRRLDLGDGIEVTMGLRGEGGKVEVKYYFSNKLQGIKKSTRTTLGDLAVEFSSAQTDDNDLLHSLSQRVR